MHKTGNTICAATLMLLLGCLGATAAQPNFSGEWRLDASQSNFSPLPAPDSMVRKISQQGAHLKIATTQVGQQREISTELSYTTDGRPCRNTISGKEVTGTAKWEDGKLVIDSRREMQGMQISQRETWSLSGDGQTLTIVNHVQTPAAGFDITIVLLKQ